MPEGKRRTLRRHPRLRRGIYHPALCTSSWSSRAHQRRVQARWLGTPRRSCCSQCSSYLCV